MMLSVTTFAQNLTQIQTETSMYSNESELDINPKKNLNNNNIAIKLGYGSLKINSTELGKGTINSLEIASSYNFNKWGVWTKYEHQKIKKLKSEQIAIGSQYTFYQKHKFYALGAVGIGLASVKYRKKNYQVDAEYVFIPANLEIGYMIKPYLGIYASWGHKWLENRYAKIYYKKNKILDQQHSELDLNGENYSFGIRFAF